MKLLLKLFPRPLLIRLSIFFRPLLQLWFAGNRLHPIDVAATENLPYGYGKQLLNALCRNTFLDVTFVANISQVTKLLQTPKKYCMWRQNK